MELPGNSDWFLLDSRHDGIKQIQEAPSNYSDLDFIQIISHNHQGALYLGNIVLDQDNIESYSNQLGEIENVSHKQAILKV